VIYADSEELEGENGSALNLIDHQPTTMWHTQWSDGAPKMPHAVVLDLGSVMAVSKLRYLPRQDAANGRIKSYRLYLSKEAFRL